MIELNLDLKFQMKPWKKALLFSLIFYLLILFLLNVIITFMLKGFNFKLVFIISVIYLGILFFCFRHMYRRFEEKFKVLLG
jgi:heme/copper-type cytochrome/quinol oxidase subunit 4